MRADKGIAADDLVDAGELRRAYGGKAVGILRGAEHGHDLRQPAPETLATAAIADRRAPDADRLPQRQQRAEQPDRGQIEQPQQRPRLALAVSDDREHGDGDADAEAAEDAVHPIRHRQRKLAAPVPQEIIARCSRLRRKPRRQCRRQREGRRGRQRKGKRRRQRAGRNFDAVGRIGQVGNPSRDRWPGIEQTAAGAGSAQAPQCCPASADLTSPRERNRRYRGSEMYGDD
jgi:hypothetical protein